MGYFDAFRYDNKRVLVVGGATGMGEAAAQVALDAGAPEVVVADIKPITASNVTAVHVDLRDKASIDAALDQLTGEFHAIFSCAGVAQDDEGIDAVNYAGQRYLLARLLERNQIPRGSAIAYISSTAGIGWEAAFPALRPLLDVDPLDFDAMRAYLVEHNLDNYGGTKQAINAHVAHDAFDYLKRGIRINSILPGPTDTPLAQANAELWLGHGKEFRDEAGVEVLQPVEQGNALVFLCSDAASGVAGNCFVVDRAESAAGNTSAHEPTVMGTAMMLGRPTAAGVEVDMEAIMAQYAAEQAQD
jgi:NAD(P)-dependent dehydrogenase (short-subunit alcohol dehydrogenase family)